jgi:15-cis-phytoene desaturase
MPRTEVIVVGAGLAGLSCAFELAEQGCEVTVLESHSVLGGRTASWIERGMPVESGLHKFLGVYRALPELLQRVGVDPDEVVTWVDELAYLDPVGPEARFTVSPYHHPVATAKTALSNTDFLPTGDKAKLAAMATAGMLRCASDPLGLDRISLGQYASEYGVSDDVIRRVLSTTTQAILFLPVESFSAYAALSPAAQGIKHGMTMRIGAFNGGMTEVMIEPIALAIRQRGGTIRTSVSVSGLIVENRIVKGVRMEAEELRADQVVLATSLKPAQDLLRASLPPEEWLAPLLELPPLSASTIQFELDQPVLESDRTNFSPTALCCFAEQSRTTFRHVPGRCSAIMYPPEEFLRLSDDELVEHAYREADDLGLPLRGHVTQYRVVNHPHDFYAMRPGTESLRPEQATPVPGLSLAGDYTKQPWSATMEGAVIAGQRAANAVLAGVESKNAS